MRSARLASGRRWIVEAPSEAPECLLALPDLLPTDSVLVLEECAMAAEMRRVIEPYRTASSLAVARQTLFPRSRQHHLRLTAELARALAKGVQDHGPAAPQLCDHLSAYLASDVLLEWHDAFVDNPMFLSRLLPEARVRAFANGLGVQVQEGDA